MYTATAEYNIFILENSAISRFEIGDSTSKWHDENSAIFYGEYKRQALRTFGDHRLARLYRKTIEEAKNIDCAAKINSIWEDGIYIKETVKFKSDDEYYGYMEKSGVFQSELCKCDGVLIEVYVFDEDCRLDLPPLNHQEYKLASTKEREPELCKNYEPYSNCLYLAALFRDLFSTHVRRWIDIDSDDEISRLFYSERRLPSLVKGKNGIGSVKPKAIRALADVKREVPSRAFSADIRDNNGKLILRASVINSAAYPEAVFLSKYRYYAERAKRLKNLNALRED